MDKNQNRPDELNRKIGDFNFKLVFIYIYRHNTRERSLVRAHIEPKQFKAFH